MCTAVSANDLPITYNPGHNLYCLGSNYRVTRITASTAKLHQRWIWNSHKGNNNTPSKDSDDLPSELSHHWNLEHCPSSQPKKNNYNVLEVRSDFKSMWNVEREDPTLVGTFKRASLKLWSWFSPFPVPPEERGRSVSKTFVVLGFRRRTMSNTLATNKTNNRTFHTPPFNTFYFLRLEPCSVWSTIGQHTPNGSK